MQRCLKLLWPFLGVLFLFDFSVVLPHFKPLNILEASSVLVVSCINCCWFVLFSRLQPLILLLRFMIHNCELAVTFSGFVPEYTIRLYHHQSWQSNIFFTYIISQFIFSKYMYNSVRERSENGSYFTLSHSTLDLDSSTKRHSLVMVSFLGKLTFFKSTSPTSVF